MSEIILNDQTIKCISLFENITKARVKDCIEGEDILFFIVNAGQLKRSLGKNGSNIRRLRKLFKKNIDVIEYSPDIKRFIRNIFHEFKINEVTIEQKGEPPQNIAYVAVDMKDKGKVIGRNSRNLKLAKEIINRYRPIDILIV
jgi:N utilization substance protein A